MSVGLSEWELSLVENGEAYKSGSDGTALPALRLKAERWAAAPSVPCVGFVAISEEQALDDSVLYPFNLVWRTTDAEHTFALEVAVTSWLDSEYLRLDAVIPRTAQRAGTLGQRSESMSHSYDYELTHFTQPSSAETSLYVSMFDIPTDPTISITDERGPSVEEVADEVIDHAETPDGPWAYLMSRGGATLEAVTIAHNILEVCGEHVWSATLPTDPVAHTRDVDLRAVVKLVGDWKWYWNHSDHDFFFEWDGSAGSIIFDWDKVVPVYDDYANETNPWDWGEKKLDYENKGCGSGWDKDNVGGDPEVQEGTDPANVGVMRYAVEATLECGIPVSTADEDDRNDPNDECISDDVFRLIVKGNYTPDILKFAAAQINVPFVMGSHWSHQAQRYVGADCADMVGHAMKKASGSQGNASNLPAPSVATGDNSLYSWACAEDPEEDYGLTKEQETEDPEEEDPLTNPQPGDIILLIDKKTETIGSDHAVVFVKDKNSNGKVDESDDIIEAAYFHKKTQVSSLSDSNHDMSNYEKCVRVSFIP